MRTFVVNNPAPTHNTWHPQYELTEEGRRRAMRQVARNQLFVLKKRHPGEAVAVCFDGVPFPGSVPA